MRLLTISIDLDARILVLAGNAPENSDYFYTSRTIQILKASGMVIERIGQAVMGAWIECKTASDFQIA